MESNRDESQRTRSNSRKERTDSNSGQSHYINHSGVGSQHDYSEEHVSAIKRIKKCKDYYEILGVTKKSRNSDIKKQYRKLALQLHPDKNKAPGASEAFQKINNAFVVLIDDQQREQYDRYGSGFESDISADEIFNVFFGGGFRFRNANFRPKRYQEKGRHQYQNQEVDSGYSVLLQMLPVLLILGISILSTFFVSEPIYSLIRTQKYQTEHKTYNLGVPYFVKQSFEKYRKGSIDGIEEQVENEYISNLRDSCIRETNYKERVFLRNKNFREERHLRDTKKSLETPSCDQLYKITEQYVLW